MKEMDYRYVEEQDQGPTGAAGNLLRCRRQDAVQRFRDALIAEFIPRIAP